MVRRQYQLIMVSFSRFHLPVTPAGVKVRKDPCTNNGIDTFGLQWFKRLILCSYTGLFTLIDPELL